MSRRPLFRSSIGVLIATSLLSAAAPATVRPNAALRFDGSGRIDFVAPFGVSLASRFTIESWIRPASFGDTIGVIGTYREDSLGRSGFGIVLAPDGRLGILREAAASGAQVVWAAQSLSAGEWSHIALQREGKSLRLFLDGMLVVSDTIPGAILPSVTSFALGGVPAATAASYAGELDELRIWGSVRTALELEASQYLRLKSGPGLVAYLSFDEGAGLVVSDEITRLPVVRLGAACSWVFSAAPVGTGRSAHVAVAEPGRRYFNGTDLLIDFLRNYRTNEVTVASLLEPPSSPPSDVVRVAPRSWLMRSSIAGSFYATLTFHLGKGAIGVADAGTPSNLRLYYQHTRGDTSWRLIGSALRVDTAVGTATFGPLQTGVDGFGGETGRFAIGTAGDSPLDLPVSAEVLSPLSAAPVCFGYPATVGLLARGRNLTYRWTSNGLPLEDVTGPELSFRATTGDDSGSYRVTIIDQDGAVLTPEPAFLAVTMPPDVWGDPTDVRVLEGKRFTFFANVDGTNLQFQWQRNGVDIPGANLLYLDLGAVDTTMSGNYRLLVWNECGRDSSVPARMTVERKPIVAAADAEPDGLGLTIVPNPASDVIVIDCGPGAPSVPGAVEVSLLDEIGRRVGFPEPIRQGSQMLIDISGLPPGTYFVQIVDGRARVLRKVSVRR